MLDAILAEDLTCSSLTDAEQTLLNFVRKVNVNSHDICRKDVVTLMHAGWSELQIAEAVHVAALFSTFNRVANAFGLASQGLLSLYDAPAGGERSSDTTLERATQ
jgi:alkylhydroperoxidase family enzyme